MDQYVQTSENDFFAKSILVMLGREGGGNSQYDT